MTNPADSGDRDEETQSAWCQHQRETLDKDRQQKGETMKRKSRLLILASLLAVAALAVGAAAAGANDGGSAELGSTAADDGPQDAADSGEDAAEGPDVPIVGPDLERATAAALAYLGEGRVTATEVGDEESYYEVEVTLDDGRQIDVQLDEAFDFVGTD
jgi:uncharacterized membrane protein YkoI